MAKAVRKKTTQKTPQKTAKKPSRKRKKNGISDGLRAFLLVAVLVAVSALISCAVIMVHSSINNKENELTFADEKSQENLPAESITATPPGAKGAPDENQIIVTVKPTPAAPVIPEQKSVTPSASKDISPVNANTVRPPLKPVENAGTLVFVIDDAGNNLRELEPFLKIPSPLTIAVLPGLPHSAEAARRIRAAGKEVILHQPMEALGAQDPGPGAIYADMSAEEIKRILARNVEEIGPVKGINNHQGSKVTENKNAMQAVLEFCMENDLYFLDSRTTAASVAPEVANKIGLKITERNVFIDNEQNKDAMLRYITSGLTRSQKNGSAVMIGHTWSPDLAPLLTEQLPIFIEQGYKIKTVYDIIN